jgi:hypothetical protein
MLGRKGIDGDNSKKRKEKRRPLTRARKGVGESSKERKRKNGTKIGYIGKNQ